MFIEQIVSTESPDSIAVNCKLLLLVLLRKANVISVDGFQSNLQSTV